MLPLRLLNIKFFHEKSHVRINGVFFGVRDVDRRLARHVECLLSVESLYLTTAVGPCALVQFSGRSFAICTMHQLLGRDPNWIGLSDTSDKTITTSGTMYWPKEDESAADADDLAIFDYTPAVEAGTIPQSLFLDITGGNCIRDGEKVIAVKLFGYLDTDQRIDIDCSEAYTDGYRITSLGMVLRPMTGRYEGPGTDPSKFQFSFSHVYAGSYRGLSGGPVFAVIQTAPFEFQAVFAGIVTQASGGRGHGIRGDRIQMLLGQLMQQVA